MFSELDLASLQIKSTGLSLDEIKKFSDWVRRQIDALKKSLSIIEHRS